MPVELTSIFLWILSARWIYRLAKRFEKPLFKHTTSAVVLYLVGGLILSFIFLFTILYARGYEPPNMEKAAASAFALFGVISVGIYYWILRRSWKSQKNVKTIDDDLLDSKPN